jgi:hypothetical protein
MVIMTKEEARSAARIWAANVKAPIDRDTQIVLMTTAAQRHKDKINRLMKQVQNERNEE